MGACEALSNSFWLDHSTCTRDNMGKEVFCLVAYGLVPLVKELGFYSAYNGKSSMGNKVTRTEYLHFLMPEKSENEGRGTQ